MLPGMMPTLVRVPGVMSPGQLGPIRRTPRLRTKGMARLMCMTGMPSVMHTISGKPRVGRLGDRGRGAPSAARR